jgi:peptide/nickel transport system permease protein
MTTLTLDSGTTAPSGAGRTASTHRRRRVGVALRLAPLTVVVLIALFGPLLVPHDPKMVVADPSLAPSAQHWMGTDSSGLDVASRVIAATRVDLTIGLMVTVAATAVGIALGLLIGMNESSRGPLGYLARGLARAVDLVQAVPAVVIGVVVVALYGASATTLVIAIAVILVPLQARLVRTEVLRVRSEAYLEAGRVAGLGELRLTLRHVLPNASWPALENTAFLFGVAVILTAALGFLGVGLPPPEPEWGSMLATGGSDASVGRWWSAVFPTLALAVTVASVALAYSAVTSSRHHR